MMRKLTLELSMLVAFHLFIFQQETIACGVDYVSSGATTMEFSVNGQWTGAYVETNTWMVNFHNYNFGTVTQLDLNKVSNVTWESCNNHVLNTTFFYRIYASGATPGAFAQMPLLTLFNSGAGDYRTKTYSNSPVLDLLNGLTNGTTYYLEVYYRSDVDTNGDSTPETLLQRNNGGLYYKATFKKGGTAGGGLTVSFSNKTDVNCPGGSDGKATASATGGTLPNTYLWSNGATTAQILNVAAGNYSVTVTSANALTGTATTSIGQPATLAPGVSATDETSASATNGTAISAPIGGTAPYSWHWSNGPTTANISGLDSGTYSVTVTDSKGCTASQTITIAVGGSIPTNYCASSGSAPWQDWIDHVQIGTLNNTSSKWTYSNFTNVAPPDLTAGELYPIAISASNGWFPYEEHWGVWIDYNRNGVFETTEKAVTHSIQANPSGTGSIACNQVISIPATAEEGITRMRVSVKRGGAPGPCEAILNGEVEDYHVRINPATGSCVMNSTTSNLLCNNNGTDANPADDTWSFSLLATQTGLPGTGWTATIGAQNITGTYGVAKAVSGLSIAAGAINFTVKDAADPLNCKKNVVVTPPPTCSNNVPCSISASISAVACDNNGTTNTGADDRFTFTVNVLGTGNGSGWTALVNGVNQTGQYGVPKNLGPYPISGGVLNFTVRDATTATCTAPLTVAPPSPCSVSGGPTGYCAAGSSFPWHEWVSRVTFAGIDKVSTKQPYNDFTTSVGSVARSQSYPIGLFTSFSWDTYSNYYRVFIDWNHDGIFQEATETAYSGILSGVPFGTADAPLNGNISIPATAGLGPTRMRITMKRSGYATACETTIPFGEVEDYTLDIAASLAPDPSGDRSQAQFEAHLFGGKVHLKSAVLASLQIDHLQIDRSSDGSFFEPLKVWNDVYLPENHSITFDETDSNPFEGDNFYRLGMTLHDGSTHFSEIRKLVNEKQVFGFRAWPNPTGGHLSLDLSEFAGNDVFLKIFHPTGILLFERNASAETGSPLEIDLKGLPNGELFLFINDGKHRPCSKKIWLIKE